MDGQSQGQGRMTIRKDTPSRQIRKDTPSRQIRNGNLLAVLLRNPDGKNTAPGHPDTDEKQKDCGDSDRRG